MLTQYIGSNYHWFQFGTNNTFSEDHVTSAKGLSWGSFCTRVLITSACMQAIRYQCYTWLKFQSASSVLCSLISMLLVARSSLLWVWKVYHGPIHQAPKKQLNPDSGSRAVYWVVKQRAVVKKLIFIQVWFERLSFNLLVLFSSMY